MAGDTDKAEHQARDFPGSCRRAHRADAGKRRRQRAPPPERPARHRRARSRTCRRYAASSVRATALAMLGCATARPYQFVGRPGARKREGAGRLAGGGELRSVPLFARAGDEQAGGALAIDPAGDQGRRQRRRQAHRRDALCGRGRISCSRRSTAGCASSPPISRAAAASRWRRLLKEVHDALRGLALRARPAAGIGVGQAAQRASAPTFPRSSPPRSS